MSVATGKIGGEAGTAPLPRAGQAGPAPLYDAPGRLLNWGHTARGGMTVEVGLSGIGAHPFDGLAIGREHGQRLVVSMGHHLDGHGDVALYEGESLLMDWRDSGRTGKMVRLMLDDGPDGAAGRHPFSHLPVGNVAGEHLWFRAVAIADDESLVPAGKLKRREPFMNLSPVTQVHVLLRDARFRAFLRENAARFVKDPAKRQAILAMPNTPNEFGAAMSRAILLVPSRAVMNQDSDEGARARRIWARVLQLWVGDSHGIRDA